MTYYRYHAQPLQLEAEPVTLYARIVADGPLTLPLELQTESVFLTQEGNHLVIQVLCFGALIALELYALLFAWSVKDVAYLVFSAYLLASGVAIFVGNGLAGCFYGPQAWCLSSLCSQLLSHWRVHSLYG